jgi:mannosylglycerate hydrolase
MSKQLHIIMHTHWDREWYFSKDETKVLLRNHMENVFDFLQAHPECIYILDGQSVMIDDYLELQPDAVTRMKYFVSNKQLRVGPWYTQTDLLLVHGESIIRNLYYGIRRAMDLGDPMLVGYAPDTFGHASQMPQIYRMFDIDSTVFWRGFSELKASKSDFIWEGLDGSRVIGINLATGYQGAKYLENDDERLRIRMEKIMSVLDQYSAGDGRLIMNGHDQMPIQENIAEIISKLKLMYPSDEVKVSDFESYIASLDQKSLEVVSGELTHSKHSRIHRTIGSTRMDIKLLNSEIEHKVFDVLEPLASILHDSKMLYPHVVIEKILKILFEVHAHDSIGGCNTDEVNQDIKCRLITARELVDNQIELYLRLLAMADRDESKTIVVANLLPEQRKEEKVEVELQTRTANFKLFDEEGKEVDYVLVKQTVEDAGKIDRQVAARLLDIKVYISKVVFMIKKIEGLEVKYLKYEEVETNRAIEISDMSDASIENERYRVSVHNQQFMLVDKQKGETFENFIFIENGGDAGDSYDYSPPPQDRVIKSFETGEVKTKVQCGEFMQELDFEIMMQVCASMDERLKGINSQSVKFQGSIRLFKGDAGIYCKLSTVNQSVDTRYRLAFKTNRRSENVLVDGYLSAQIKPTYLKEELDVWEKEAWVEKPISVETCQSYVTIEENHRKAVILTQGLKEYEVIDDSIYLTLYRSFSHLGKRNLVNRPGRPSGIEVETPGNQLLGQSFSYQFMLCFDLMETHPSKLSKAYLCPLVAYQKKEFNRFNLNTPKQLHKPNSNLSLELNGSVVSAVKRTVDGNHLLIRIFNPTSNPIQLNLPESVRYINALETRLLPKKINTINPQEILQFII